MDVEKELIFYLKRELKKLEVVFRKVRFKSKEREIWNLVLSYWEDCKYFYKKNELVKSFELVNYIWGMLDILANLNMLEIPKEIKGWFKIDLSNDDSQRFGKMKRQGKAENDN